MYELLFTEIDIQLGTIDIGRGISGIIRRSKCENYAIKVPIPDKNGNMPRLDKEAEIMASILPHKNVCGIIRSMQINARIMCIVMELIIGISLREWFDRLDFDGPIDWIKILCIFIQIFSGIAHLHEHRIFHGDIKPANIMIIERDDGTIEIKLVDFGESSHFGSIPQRETGSPLYFSPENSNGFGLNHTSDIWAAAIIMLECVSGGKQTPWFLMDFKSKEDVVEKLQKLDYSKTPFPPEYLQHENPIAVLLARIAQRCLALDKSERPSAQDVVTELSEKLAEFGGA
jgi:eukaryotic-like serine/threonine-protein kinase